MHSVPSGPGVTSRDRQQLARLPDDLSRRIRGQGPAVSTLAQALQRFGLQLQPAPRFLLLGPTGVGKTESARAFTELLFGEGQLLVFDCSEFASPEALPVLLGDRHGDRGRFGALADRPPETLLFDEVEKGTAFHDLLLQILEPGQVTLACGEVVDLSRFVIVCTGNIGSAETLDATDSNFRTLERHILEQAKQTLRPEILNRFDDLVVFRALEFEAQREIVELKLREYLASIPYAPLSYEPAVVDFLLRHGMDRRYGARPLIRAIRRFVGNAVANQLFAGGDGNGTLVVDRENQQLKLHP